MRTGGNHLIIGYKLTTYKLFSLLAALLGSFLWNQPVLAQATPPDQAILELREGYLIIRLPAYRAKIDTLEAFIARSTNPENKARLQSLLLETIESRDSLHAGYLQAFRNEYEFSKVAYFYDYEAHNLNTATYYNLDGERIAIGDIMHLPLYYLAFERTTESKLDGLLIYNRNMKLVPRPFPNNFTLGGLNVLFLKLSDKHFPSWRVSKMQKQFFKYYNAVKMMEATGH
jgi:hypothetical protein